MVTEVQEKMFKIKKLIHKTFKKKLSNCRSKISRQLAIHSPKIDYSIDNSPLIQKSRSKVIFVLSFSLSIYFRKSIIIIF